MLLMMLATSRAGRLCRAWLFRDLHQGPYMRLDQAYTITGNGPLVEKVDYACISLYIYVQASHCNFMHVAAYLCLQYLLY